MEYEVIDTDPAMDYDIGIERGNSMMKCDHGNPVWYIRGGNALTYNRVGWNCIQCILRSLTRGRGMGRRSRYQW